MNPECNECPRGARILAQHEGYQERFEQAEKQVMTYNQQISDCTPIDIIIGARRKLRQERADFISNQYAIASQQYIVGITAESKVNQCAGPFDLAAIGLGKAADGLACGIDIIGVRRRYNTPLDNDTTA